MEAREPMPPTRVEASVPESGQELAAARAESEELRRRLRDYEGRLEQHRQRFDRIQSSRLWRARARSARLWDRITPG